MALLSRYNWFQMNKTEITHANVLKLVDVVKGEREARVALEQRLEKVEKALLQTQIRLEKAEKQANTAFATAMQGRV
jgi:hypothetical protein